MTYLTKARSRTATAELLAALRRAEPRVAAMILAAVRSIRDQASLRAIARALETGDVDRAIELSGVASLGPRLQGAGAAPGAPTAVGELSAAFQRGAASGMRQLPRSAALAAHLDVTNPRAVAFLQTHLPALVREVTNETREALRLAALRGFEEGRPLPLIAREMRDSIGLTRKQSQAIINFRRQLESGELGRGKAPWDRRLSATEAAQARSIFVNGGERSDRVNALVERYHESLVNRRAKNIARTEVHRAHVEGQNALWEQAIEDGLLDPLRTRRVWLVTPDDRLRDSHAAIPEMNPLGVGLDEPFETPFGPVMSPADPHEELINCRCTVALEFNR